MDVHLIDTHQDALLEFVELSDPDVAQERSGHLREGRLHESEPGAVLGGMDVHEASRLACQVSHGLLEDVGTVAIQRHADDRLARVVLMQAFEQGDELAAAMARLDVGDDLAAVQVSAPRGSTRCRGAPIRGHAPQRGARRPPAADRARSRQGPARPASHRR